ncbi:hypothetical protein AbraIFM66950_001718, partial [Aspergillus brasiliensis]
MPRKASSWLVSFYGSFPRITGQKEKYNKSSTSTYRQTNSNPESIFVLKDPADFPRWKGIIERLLQDRDDVGMFPDEFGTYDDGILPTRSEKDYNILWKYVPRQFHHHFPHPRYVRATYGAQMQLWALWEAVREWAINCDICGLVQRKILSDPLDPVKAREHPTSRFLLQSNDGKHCQYCSLIYQCLQAYYPSFETDKDTLVVGIYPTTGGFSLLIRNTQTTSWIESMSWAEAFP